ncbi:ataxin-10-like [Uloborus diversus]|uniref:ataxin-10-like n=1 Tax=Uloborus diversus TaxID=327109 RepID=UPI0024096CCF|nr:ataxin-10-like [Uloborus diversus]
MIENQICQLDKLFDCGLQIESLIPILKSLTELMKIDHFRYEINDVHWKTISKVANHGLEILRNGDFKDIELDFLADLFRFLRNSCAGSARNQMYIFSSDIILNCAKTALDHFKEKNSEKEVLVLRCCLQFYGNLVCSGTDFKLLVWNLYIQRKMFRDLLQHRDAKVQEYSMMVLHNCMIDEHISYIISTKDGHDILVTLMNILCDNLIDWGILFLELLLKQESFMQNCYEVLPGRNKLLILDLITHQLNNSNDGQTLIPPSALNFVTQRYLNLVMNIMKVCNTEFSEIDASEIVKILTLLCAASISDQYSHSLKSSKELLEKSLDVLKSVHLLGKKSCNAFSSISNLNACDQFSKEDIEAHPSFCFKKNLIRLIGNLCYGCRENQDLVRKLDGIPLLLDCSNLDIRNPFIMQWCILAIRNVLENNQENQAVLAGMSVSGDLVESALIKELGFQVCKEDGKFVLKSSK